MHRDETRRDQAAQPTRARIREAAAKAGRMAPIVTTIERRLFDRSLNVNELWRVHGVRDHSAAARFTAAVGEPPSVYISRARLEVAARLLVETRLRVWRIAELVGYEVQAFQKAFKSWSGGLTPMTYRQRPPRASSGEAEDSGSGDPLRCADRALAGAAVETAFGFLAKAEPGSAKEARMGLAYHCRAAHRLFDGDVDRAYEDLGHARDHYTAADDLPARVLRHRRRIAVPFDTDAVFAGALCPDCRRSFVGDAGRSIRYHLRHALEKIPLDLPWFSVACDDCYRVVWDAVDRARFGLINNAFRAWWISENADVYDRSTPASLGRFIATLVESERLTFQDQEERRNLCRLALRDAESLGEVELIEEARIHLGNALRTIGDYVGARRLLQEPGSGSTWLVALWANKAGSLESDTKDYMMALCLLEKATQLYADLDRHFAARMLIQMAKVHFSCAAYDRSISSILSCQELLDERRDPLMAKVVVPMNLAVSYACLDHWEKAEFILDGCQYDRDVHGTLYASELFIRACFMLQKGQPREALRFFEDSMARLENLHRFEDAALAASYSVEALVRVGQRSEAIQRAAVALRFFQACGSDQKTLAALGQLRRLLESAEIGEVAAYVRTLARRHGGWLPERSRSQV